jgi:hypothetical protein
MPVPYQNEGPIDCTISLDVAKLKDKSVVVTGGTIIPDATNIVLNYTGSSGLGHAYVKAFLAAGSVHA